MMKVTIEQNQLVIRLPLQTPTPSSTGKTKIVATSGGNKATDVVIQGQTVTVGVNAYIKA